MDMAGLVLLLVIAFFIIFSAVRLAIEPLINENQFVEKVKTDQLLKFKSVGLISSTDIENYKIILDESDVSSEIKKDYIDAIKVINVLHKSGMISNDEYEMKVMGIENHFKMN